MEALQVAIKGLHEVTARQLQEAPSLKYVLAIFHAKETGSALDTDCVICLHDALLNFRKLSEEEIISIIKGKSMNEKRIFLLKGTRVFKWKQQRINNDNITDSIAEEWINYNSAVLQNLILTPRALKRAIELKVADSALIFWGKRSGLSEQEVLEMKANITKGKESEAEVVAEAPAEAQEEAPATPETPKKPIRSKKK